MMYRGISVTAPREGSPVHIKRLKEETCWSVLKYRFPELYKEASQLVSLYDMALGVLRYGVVSYYQAVFADDEPDLNPNRLLQCEEWHCCAFDALCRFAKLNVGYTSDNKRLKNAAKAFHAMEGDPSKGYIYGATGFERELGMVSVYFFQICEQKAEYLCKVLEKNLSAQNNMMEPSVVERNPNLNHSGIARSSISS